ncbi:MAG: glutamate-5-semialdehyde dehydrogenase [Bacteroidetes bacterium]|nr:glutamate-5-semialdehyde dehydrogenase [Bacteroidota bacterium]
MDSIQQLLKSARKSSGSIMRLTNDEKKTLLATMSRLIMSNVEGIKVENQKDLVRMDDADPKKDRLLLNDERIKGLADSLEDVARLEDPTGKLLYRKQLDNGLEVTKISVPVGVVGIIYESRPNVTIDVAALCIRSGNAVVLRGGSDAEFSNKFLVSLIHQAMEKHGVTTDAVVLLPTDRKHVKEMLTATDYVDIIIPRGSQNLIDFVRANSKVPTIETGAGVCHTYVESSADLDSAAAIVVNAKVQRPSVCNALDTMLVDRAVAASFLPKIKTGMEEYDVDIYADESAYGILADVGYSKLHRAGAADFGKEYLGYGCSVKVVEGPDEALEHISEYSSRHSEAIISSDAAISERFLNEVDAAAVYANASTRFTDGGVFGLGAEIGISTQKLHARGPFALEKLTTEKWVVRGSGQVRE